jgi:hypothetical protein
MFLALITGAFAGTCPSPDTVTVSNSKTSSTIYVGDLQVIIGRGGTEVEVSGFKQGNDMVVRLTDSGTTFTGDNETRGSNELNILDRGEAGDNIFDGVMVSEKGVVLEMIYTEYETIYVVAGDELGVGIICDDGSMLGILTDGADISWLQESGKGVTETTLSASGQGWSFPPSVASVDLDGSFHTVNVSGVEMDELALVNGAKGRHGIQVEVVDSVIEVADIQNVTKLSVDGDTSITTLSLDASSPINQEK